MAKRGNGEGSITRHKKSGLWMARYVVQTPTGTKRKAVYAKKREEVRDKLAKVLADRAGGIVIDDKNLAVGNYLDNWLAENPVSVKLVSEYLGKNAEVSYFIVICRSFRSGRCWFRTSDLCRVKAARWFAEDFWRLQNTCKIEAHNL